MMWRLFRRSAKAPAREDWWQDAERAAAEPSAEAIADLRRGLDPGAPLDEPEQQAEMLDGLEQLLELSAQATLPVVTSQHRVIGADTCHFLAPVTLAGPDGVPGKLFLTSRRLVIVAGGVTARPWHGVRRLARAGRSLVVGAGDQLLEARCNAFGDALTAHHVASRLQAETRRT